MTYLWIFLVIAIALAPLTHFIPSKRQRAVARMREHAAINGLFVEFRRAPGAAQSDQARTLYYGMRLPPTRGEERPTHAWLHKSEEWKGLNHRLEAPPAFRVLPTQITAASIDEASCGVYWQEEGDIDEVELIVDALKAWAANPALNLP
ncbi:MAG: hypothetical protein AAGF35_13330 [Pseudomonadota bacterium]